MKSLDIEVRIRKDRSDTILSCLPVVAIRRTTGSRPLGWGERKLNGITLSCVPLFLADVIQLLVSIQDRNLQNEMQN